MTIIFPKNNLPEPAQPWAREVQKQLANVIASDNANEINNAARDNQLNSSLITLTGVVADVKTAAQEASDAINGLIGLGSTGSEYSINASNITAGTITGITVQTGSSGQRIVLSGTTLDFYSPGGTYSGKLVQEGGDSVPSVNMESADGSNYIQVWNSGARMFADGSTVVAFDGQILLSSALVSTSSSFSAGGILTANSGIQSSNIPGNGLGSGAVDVYASSSLGRLGVQSSSLKTKQEIEDIEFDVNSILSIAPKSFKYTVDVNEFGLENADRVVGFIAEDLDQAGLNYFVHYDANDEPMSIPYSKYVVALQAVVRNLNDRITALENGA